MCLIGQELVIYLTPFAGKVESHPIHLGKESMPGKKKKKTEKKVLGGMKEGNRKPIPCALGRLCILD